MTASNPVVCVFCGSGPGNSPAHLAAARSLAEEFHRNKISLVYGGGTSGIMGEIARTLVSLSGSSSVHGVIPKALMQYEAPTPESGRDDDLDEVETPPKDTFGKTTVVKDMHSRKMMMVDLVQKGGKGSGFVALSGGYGTMEELMEVTTWNQLGIHSLGVVVFNVYGYYDALLAWVRGATDAGFISKGNKDILVEATDAGQVVKKLMDYRNSEERMKLSWDKA